MWRILSMEKNGRKYWASSQGVDFCGTFYRPWIELIQKTDTLVLNRVWEKEE